MKHSMLIWAAVAASSFATGANAADFCAQVVTPAVDSKGVCKEYPTPCDVPSGWKSVASCPTEDTSLDALENSGSVAAPDFSVKTFPTCSAMKDKLSDFIKEYYEKNPSGGYWGRPIPLMGAVDDVAVRAPVPGNKSSESAQSLGDGAPSGAKDYSQTNVQIGGVDESEIVKTDGSYSYYFNSDDHRIYVTDVRDPKNVRIVKKIKVPASYANPEIYLADGKLVLFSTRFVDYKNPYLYWYSRNDKTVVVAYDVKDPLNPRIDRFFQIDGSVRQTRRVGKYLYVLSNAEFSFPYQRYVMPLTYGSAPDAKAKLNEARIDKDFSVKKVMPKVVELNAEDETPNFRWNGRALPYRLETGDAASCSDVEFVLPDSATLEKYSFSPSFTTLSVINLADPEEKTKSKVFFGDVGEIMMSQNSLFATSQLYSPVSWKCPSFARCISPWWDAGMETLVHKFSIAGNDVKYAATAVVPGSPLNKYSMDESAAGDFRIVTTENGENRSTRVTVLDKALAPLGSVSGIAPGENFQASRFIGDRLYLVTFEQIDPLFVIDVSDSRNPKIEGELKMPGYSVYLHPYADGKLIGLGYDTKQNQWGGTQNAGLKVDLYDVSDVKNPKQLKTLTMGSVGSSSDVLWNPKLFVWNAAKRLLFLPATLTESANDPANPYRSKDAFQGTVVVKVTEDGISEVARLSHVDRTGVAKARAEECAQYSGTQTSAPKCEKLVGGGEYCPSNVSYVPPYCYESATDGEYFANHLWNHQKEFVLRNLYLDDTLYTISNAKMVGHDMANAFSVLSETLWK